MSVISSTGNAAASTAVPSSPPLHTPVLKSVPTLDLHLPGPRAADLDQAADLSLSRARQALLNLQKPEGYWVGELQGDSILESEFILLKFILGQEDDPDLPLIANYLRSLQIEEGGWAMYPGGASDLCGTVKAYFALKLMGDPADAPHMRRACEVVLRLGGAERCNSFSNFYLAALGQISYDVCPSIPPEIVYLPRWMYFNLHAVSAWTRTMILPLAIVSTLRPMRDVPPEKWITELFTGSEFSLGKLRGMPNSWREAFLLLDVALKQYDKLPLLHHTRQEAIRAAEQWLLERIEGSEGLGAIFPPMVYILIVFRALGYPDDHPKVLEAHKQLRDLFLRDGDKIRIQPCHSPVWDTGLALHALAESGLSPDTDAARRSSTWLLDKECRYPGDWAVNCPHVEPSGWYFEFANPHYPDVDDTAMVVMALRRAGGPVAREAIKRGLQWLLAFQNDDGGWAAFDRTIERPILEHVPFADHNAMQDPSCPDITGRVLECLGHCGFNASYPAARRAIDFIRKRQEPEGCWFGRWGVNYIYGTWQVLTGLKSIGESTDRHYVRRAADWLRAVQKPDGSFGESCDSYEDPSLKGQGPSTASQTAWGAMGLMAAAGPRDPAVQRAIQWLVEHQGADGNWEENFYTGTGFPKVFYLKYHLYRLYFPLTALARYKRMRGA
jgi:squalene-hopene/tetraprenyl-beta-curcumene cyclase